MHNQATILYLFAHLTFNTLVFFLSDLGKENGLNFLHYHAL